MERSTKSGKRRMHWQLDSPYASSMIKDPQMGYIFVPRYQSVVHYNIVRAIIATTYIVYNMCLAT